MKHTVQSWKRFRAAYGLPVLAFLLTGCAISPDVAQPVAVSSEAALGARADMVEDHAALVEEPVPSEWWELFRDANLTLLQKQAAASNLDLQSAAARMEESQAQLGLANAARRPQLAAQASYARSANSENSPMAALGAPTSPTDNWSIGLQAGWELDLWGHLDFRSQSAEARLLASAYGMDAIKVSVAGDVARTYLLLRGIQGQQRVVEENREIAENLVRLTESRQRNGVATRHDAAAARADLALIDARLTQLSQQRQVLMNALAFLLGQAPRELDAMLGHAELPLMPEQLPVGIPSELARNRPDILQADAQLRAAVADIGAAQADFYPRISLTGSAGVQAFDLSDLGSWSSRRFTVGPTLYLPIFQGGRLQSNLALGEARHRLAGVAYQQTVLRAWHEVDDALTAYAAELKRHEQLQIALTQNQTALNVAQRAYQQGTADFTAVLVARRSLLSTQAELVDCATASALSVVALYRALGGGWSPELRASAEGGAA